MEYMKMTYELIKGILLPFLGTSVGAFAVFVMKRELSRRVGRVLDGFAAGVMTAASVWSLLLPAMEHSGLPVPLSFIPAVVGFWAGVLFLSVLEKIIPRCSGGPSGGTMLTLAVVLHNIPEGMAVGIAYASLLGGEASAVGAFALSLGIAVQNVPEGAIISMPLRAKGASRMRAFLGGVLSGAVEPAASALTLLLTSLVSPFFPYFLGFAAGAMMFVVADELIPDSAGEPSGTLAFSLGFTLMMALDVALG